jgi:hypothetical protein
MPAQGFSCHDLCAFSALPHARLSGASFAPGIPCALFTSKGARFLQNPGVTALRQRGGVS